MAGQRVYLGGISVAVVLFCMAFPTQGVNLNVKNNCAGQLTLYWQAGTQQTPNTAALANGATKVINVGAAWSAGVVWIGESNRALASLAEFTIVNNGPDFYDISLVNAYDVGVEIQPTAPSGSGCKDIKCVISNLQSFCTAPNKYTPASGGNHEACTNVDGPGTVPTAGTNKFKAACPDAYSYSKDDQTSTWTCTGVTDYNVVFCPAGVSSNF